MPEEKKTLPAESAMKTFPQLEIFPESARGASEKRASELEKSILELAQEIANLEELKIQIEQMVDDNGSYQALIQSLFNSVNESLSHFSEKMEKEVDYARELELGARNAEQSVQIKILTKALESERAQISLCLSEMSGSVKKCAQTVSEKCEELESANSVIERGINRFRQDAGGAMENEFKALKAESERLLSSVAESAQRTLEAVKKQSIEWLKQCEEENRILISRIPRVREKISFKDAAIAILAALSAAGMALNIFGK